MAELPLPSLIAEERRIMCCLGALEAIRSGTTAVLEDSVDIGDYASALPDTGLRITFTRTRGRPGWRMALASRAHLRSTATMADLPQSYECAGCIAIGTVRAMAESASAISAHAPDMMLGSICSTVFAHCRPGTRPAGNDSPKPNVGRG